MSKLSLQVCGQIKCNVLSNDASACNAGRLKADHWYEKLVSFYMDDGKEWRKKAG